MLWTAPPPARERMEVGAVKAPRFGRAKGASDHDNRSRCRDVGFQVHAVGAEGNVIVRRQIKRRYDWLVIPRPAAGL
jgi:hypothetical protein